MDNYNVLIVHNYYKQPGGEDSVVRNEKEMLEKYGNRVFLYTRNNNEIDNYNLLQKALLPINYLFNFKTYFDVKRIIKENNIDIVHVHNTINIISPSVYYASFKMKKPVVQTIHNFRLLCPNGLLYRDGNICEDCINKGLNCAIKHNCYRNSKTQTLLSVLNMKIQRSLGLYRRLNYICLTEFNKNKLLSLKQINPDNIYIKPNFIETKNNNIKTKEERKKQFVYAGRLDEYKGIEFIFNVWKQIDKEVKLIVFGDGILKDWCTKFIKENNLSNIEMMGSVGNDVVRKCISESYGTIMASRLYEGFPMAIIESISCGTPVISANLGNAGSLTVENITGYKYIFESIKSCIESINKAINNEGIYENAYRYYLDNYSLEKNYKLLKTIYKDIKRS